MLVWDCTVHTHRHRKSIKFTTQLSFIKTASRQNIHTTPIVSYQIQTQSKFSPSHSNMLSWSTVLISTVNRTWILIPLPSRISIIFAVEMVCFLSFFWLPSDLFSGYPHLTHWPNHTLQLYSLIEYQKDLSSCICAAIFFKLKSIGEQIFRCTYIIWPSILFDVISETAPLSFILLLHEPYDKPIHRNVPNIKLNLNIGIDYLQAFSIEIRFNLNQQELNRYIDWLLMLKLDQLHFFLKKRQKKTLRSISH